MSNGRSVVALLTDFGYKDPYIGIMKGVIAQINPDALIIDLAHDLPKFNIRYAAFVLLASYKYFPKGTIFVCVIDPGVGTQREGIVVKTNNYVFVGPNNGVMSLAAIDDGIIEIRRIENRKFMLKEVSYTFHGRDIFSPVAAWISRGVTLSEIGPKLDMENFIKIEISKPNISPGLFEAEVLIVDSFGNVITNIRGANFLRTEKIGSYYIIVKEDKRHIARFVRTYGEAQRNELIILIGSHNYVEIAVNMGSARDRLNLNPGEKIKIIRLELYKENPI